MSPARQSKADQLRYLKRRGESWSVRVRVPPSLVAKLGATHLQQALFTRDLDEANRRKWPIVTAMKRQIEEARGHKVAAMPLSLADEARLNREGLRTSDEDDDSGLNSDAIESLLIERAEEIEKATGDSELAQKWYRSATTREKTCAELMNDWLKSDAKLKEGTKYARRRAWDDAIERVGVILLPGDVTDRMVMAYFDSLCASGLGQKTVRDRVAALTAFWTWMEGRRIVARGVNPWKGLQIREGALKGGAHGGRPARRHYTDSELIKLLKGNEKVTAWKTAAYLRDLIPLMLVTGLRINEACSLRVRHVTFEGDSAFLQVVNAKTSAGNRSVPVVRGPVLALLKRRTEGKTPDEQVFHELKAGGMDDKLAQSAVKAFTRYRRECGIEDGPDAHSLRRAFATGLEHAGVPMAVQNRLFGHQSPTMIQQLYSLGASPAQLIEAVQQVKFSAAVEACLQDHRKVTNERGAE